VFRLIYGKKDEFFANLDEFSVIKIIKALLNNGRTGQYQLYHGVLKRLFFIKVFLVLELDGEDFSVGWKLVVSKLQSSKVSFIGSLLPSFQSVLR
jgi:hypothetical protein